MYVRHRAVIVFSPLFNTNNFAKETKVYVHIPYPRTLYVCVRDHTVTIFSSISNTNNFATETLHGNEGLRTPLTPTYIVCVST